MVGMSVMDINCDIILMYHRMSTVSNLKNTTRHYGVHYDVLLRKCSENCENIEISSAFAMEILYDKK